MHSSFRARLRPLATWVSELVKRIVRGIYHDHPVPLFGVYVLDRILPGTNPLMPSPKKQDAKKLRHRRLADALRDEPLGEWAVGPESLNFLQRLIERTSPALVLELGSGLSTVCLTRYALDVVGPQAGQPLVISIEQDRSQAERTCLLLDQEGLSAHARVAVAPLVRQRVLDVDTTCFSMREITAALEQRSPELVFIDGPSGPPGIRLATLPSVLHRLNEEAWFVLDDAFRSAEIAIGRRWANMPAISVHGVAFVEKGLLIGRATPPGRPK